jgi:GGDEF domain-containing protein
MIFAHDGLHDSVTRLSAPPLFYESLKREISLAERNKTDLTLLRIVLESDGSLAEATLISFADLLTNAFRLEDYKARLGELEFLILLQGKVDLASYVTERLIARWALEGPPGVRLAYSLLEYKAGQSALEWMNRLDGELLLRASF